MTVTLGNGDSNILPSVGIFLQPRLTRVLQLDRKSDTALFFGQNEGADQPLKSAGDGPHETRSMISDVPVNVMKGRPWVALATKPVVTDGQQAVDAQGRPRWSALLEWASARNRFSDAVIRAFLEAYPEAPDDGGAAP
jgi:hypothetical protein